MELAFVEGWIFCLAPQRSEFYTHTHTHTHTYIYIYLCILWGLAKYRMRYGQCVQHVGEVLNGRLNV